MPRFSGPVRARDRALQARGLAPSIKTPNKNARQKGRVVLNRNRTHLEWFNLESGQCINRRSDCHVRSQRCRHNGIRRRYHARRIHRAAQRPNKPAPRNLGLQYNHAMRRNGAMNGRRARLLPLTRADYLQSTVTTRAARSNQPELVVGSGHRPPHQSQPYRNVRGRSALPSIATE